MGRLFVVSNRVAPVEEGKPASGGLAVGVLDALRESSGVWFGWSGEIAGKRSRRVKITDVGNLQLATLDFSRQDYQEYYNGFANGTLWPLLHYRLDVMRFARQDFTGYLRVNALFANVLAPMVTADDTVWVHDYHLFPLGEELRRAGANPALGLFLHTPFPPYGVLRALPTSDHLLESMCAYDLVGFQTERDRSNFYEAVIDAANGHRLSDGSMEAFGRIVRAEVFPIGIDPEEMAALATASARSNYVLRFQRDAGHAKVVIGVDRLDYSKGLVQRFQAYGQFLATYPRYHGQVTYLQIATPTRADVPEYRQLRRTLSEVAGDIAGRYAEPDWNPIRYLNRSFARRTLAGFYRTSKIGFVTPLMDGMNLVAKEYVAAQDPDDPGVLILSRFAGAAAELKEALIINPYDIDATTHALRTAISMRRGERLRRWQAMQATLTRNNVAAWRNNFLAALKQTKRRPSRRARNSAR